MEDFGLKQMQQIQKELQEKYKDKWNAKSPKEGRNMLLWMIAECGEVAEIIKKNGESEIMNSLDVRNRFIEEMCDVLMYYNEVLLCYDISIEELKKTYLKKHQKNMNRW